MRTPMHRPGLGLHHQRGVVLLTVALSLLFLLGFMGVALDLGRLFVVRSELQTALDSCALAAARELDATSTALQRARSAGVRAGKLNRLNFQSSTWAAQPQLTEASLNFFDKDRVETTDPLRARYARCAHRHTAQGAWLLPALNAFAGASVPAGIHQVATEAVATRASAQNSCPLPLALRPKTGQTGPDYGFAPGQWVVLLSKAGVAPGGYMGWANLDGSSNAAETERELRGFCGSRVGDTLGTPGVQASVAAVWNTRFGIYKSQGEATIAQPPDVTGYAWTTKNWKTQKNAYAGTPPSGSQADPSGTAANYQTKAAEYASCGNTTTQLALCEAITGLKLAGGFKELAAPGLDLDFLKDGHYEFGAKNRRVVTVPVVNASNQVIDFACMLMLQPLSVPVVDVQLEYIANAGAADSPCTTGGLPGGSAGPLVPVLVR